MSGSVYLPERKRPVPKSAKIIEGKDGKKYASWTRKGKAYTREIVDGKVKVPCNIYRMKWKTEEDEWDEDSTKCTTRKAALQVLQEKKNEVERIRAGIVTRAELEVADKSTLTIEEALQRFTTTKLGEGRTEKHIKETVSIVERTAEACVWRQLRDMNTAKAGRYINERAAKVAPRTCKKEVNALKAFGGWCCSTIQGLLTENPFQALRYEGQQKTVYNRRPFRVDEVRRLIEAAKVQPLQAVAGRNISEATRDKLAWKGETRATVYILMAGTGLRWSETRTLRISDVNLKEASIYLQPDNEKNRKGATIKLNTATINILRDYMAERLRRLTGGNTAFPGAFDKQPFFDSLPQYMTEQVKKDCAIAKIDLWNAAGRKVDMHSFRSFFGTELARAGTPLAVLQKMMRHSSPALTMKYYIFLDEEDFLEAAERLPDYFNECLEVVEANS
ncbi:MAG: site-specific integrase [Candidatus Hydrogenedens sp.]|jgi:integrase|nr:site-specific integrase [Candidatus Hydrogenedens sp.]